MPRPLATCLLLFCTMLWGFAFIAQKTAMDSMGPLTFAGIRYSLGGILILPLALWECKRHPQTLPLRIWGLIAAVAVVFFLGSWLQQAALTTTTATNAGFLTGLYVFFVPLLGYLWFRTHPHPLIFVCVPLALIGTWYLNGGGLDSFNNGDGLVVISALFWAGHVVLLSHATRATSLPIFISALTFLSAGFTALLFAFLFETPRWEGLAIGWMEIAYVSLCSTAIAFTLQAVGQQYVPPANAAIILSAESLFAALGGALLLGERLPPIGYAGAALIFGAILAVEALPPLWTRRQIHATLPTN